MITVEFDAATYSLLLKNCAITFIDKVNYKK